MSLTTQYREKYFKLYGPPLGLTPEPQIKIYYYGIPLFYTADFEGDRYSFVLPLNLRQKMNTGNLLADFSFTLEDSLRQLSRTPVSLRITDRYD